MRDGFSGVPAIKYFGIDWLHLLDFLERASAPLQIKNVTALISCFYHVCIGIVSSLSAKYDIFIYSFQKLFKQFAISGFQCVVSIEGRIASSLPFRASSA